jgi:hypothetical protein
MSDQKITELYASNPFAMWSGGDLIPGVRSGANGAGLASTFADYVISYNAKISAFAGLAAAADKLPYFTSAGSMGLASFTAFSRSLLADADAASARASLGLGSASTLGFDTDGTLAANSDALIPTQKAVKTYVSGLVAANDAMVFKGVIDCSASPNYLAADLGHTYRVSVAGKIGGGAGINVEIGDILLCMVDGSAAGTQAAVGANWEIIQANIDGAVVGPASAASGNLTTFSGTSGKVVQDSGVAISTDGTMASNSDAKVATEKAVRTYVAAQVAASGSAITLAAQAWVEVAGNDSTGTLGDPAKPFATIDAALDALPSTGGVVHIGSGNFAPITCDATGPTSTSVNGSSKLKSNVIFQGSGMPRKKSDNTGLVAGSGTIIEGHLTIHSSRHNIHVYDLGIDVGSTVIAARYGGTAQNGLVWFNIGNPPSDSTAPAEGAVVDRVISICKDATSTVHSICLENVKDPQVGMVQAYLGYHGFVLKSDGGTIGEVISRGHGGSVCIIKSNTGAQARNITIGAINGGNLGSGDTPVGLIIEAIDSKNTHDIVIGQLLLTGVGTYDVETTSASGSSIYNVRINGVFTDNGAMRANWASQTQKDKVFINGRPQATTTLTISAGHAATDASVNDGFHIFVNGSFTLDNPTNLTDGQVLNYQLKIDGTGGYTMTLGTKFKFAGGSVPTLSTTPNAKDLLSCVYNATEDILLCAYAKGMA